VHRGHAALQIGRTIGGACRRPSAGSRFPGWADGARALAARVRAIGQGGGPGRGAGGPAGSTAGSTTSGATTGRTNGAIGAIGGGAPGIAGGLWSGPDAAIDETATAVAGQAEEQQLRAARLEAVLGSLAEGVIVADEERHVIFANPVVRQLLHLPAGGADGALDTTEALGDPDASQRASG
jgi:PAS domain-containing protein